MGRHNIETKRQYRRNQNRRKRKKKSILNRGNIFCNCPDYISSKASTSTNNLLEKSSTPHNSDTKSTFHVSETTGKEPSSEEAKNYEIKYNVNTDPLIVGLREYILLKRRIQQIIEKKD